MSDAQRERLGLTALGTGLSIALAYAALRAYVFLRVGPLTPVLVIRTASIAYYQALAVGAIVGLGWGMFLYERLASREARATVAEWIERASLPIVGLVTLASWLFP